MIKHYLAERVVLVVHKLYMVTVLCNVGGLCCQYEECIYINRVMIVFYRLPK